MSELDKLLLERINLADVVYGVQNTANGTSLSKRISPLSIETSFNTPKKIRCNSFDEIQSSSTLTPSKSTKESKSENKLFEEVPDFEEFYSDEKYDFNVINSNIWEIEDEQVTHNKIEYWADDMFEVNEPISFFNEDTIQ